MLIKVAGKSAWSPLCLINERDDRYVNSILCIQEHISQENITTFLITSVADLHHIACFKFDCIVSQLIHKLSYYAKISLRVYERNESYQMYQSLSQTFW